MISVSKRAPNLPHDLRALTENLKAKISRSKADIPNKLQIVEAFELLLGSTGKILIGCIWIREHTKKPIEMSLNMGLLKQ